MNLAELIKSMEGIEAKIDEFHTKAAEEIKNTGTLAAETLSQIETIGTQQHELAERVLQLEQRGLLIPMSQQGVESLGKQFVKAEAYQAFVGGSLSKCRVEVQANTLTGSDTNVAPDRKPGIVGGDSEILTLERFLNSLPTSSNAIEYTREASFTNAAAETAENTAKPESALTWSLQNMPVSTVAHWIKISRQLAADNPALAAYVDTRMTYGVNQRVETQLGAGNGTAPNISGLLDTGNFTAHGYAAAALGTLTKVVLIRKIIADLWVAGYIPNGILLNPADFAQIEIDIFDTNANNMTRVATDAAGNMRMFGVPVVQSNGITADNLLVGAFDQAATVHNRSGVVVEMSESDDTNFQSNLITIRAERRLALTVERPSAIIGGDLTPV